MSVADNAAVLSRAEERLRASGLTGGQAFAALLDAVRQRLGDPVTVQDAALAAIDDLDLTDGGDLLGLAYERFFPDLFKGRKGQYFTPLPLLDLVLAHTEIRAGDTVLDPTCGSAGFLVRAARLGACVRGIEIDPFLAQLARLNLRLAGVDGEVLHADFFTREPEPVDVVVANPPFSVEISDRRVLDRFELGRGRRRVLSDWLFLEALERWVVPGGRAAILIPWSVVVNPSAALLRERIDRSWRREALCALPEGIFRPFGGAAGRAFVLWLRRSEGSGSIRWASLGDPGYDVRSRAVRATGSSEIRRLIDGEGWSEIPAGSWTPEVSGGGTPLASVARARSERVVPAKHPQVAFSSIDLADSDKATGEVRPVERVGASMVGPRVGLREGDVLVSRLRPELGNVSLARRAEGCDGPLVGSPEWIALEVPSAPHYALHALRTPTWRASLPVTGGQTRPRTTTSDVLASTVRWPPEALAERVDGLSRALHEERARLGHRLDRLQEIVDRYVEGELDDAGLAVELDRLDD